MLHSASRKSLILKLCYMLQSYTRGMEVHQVGEVIEFPAILPSGNPLWPQFWSMEELEALRNELPNSKWQAQYQQNIAQQNAQFGGAGGLGSARQALAGRQAAGANQALQAQTAAQVQQGIAAQRGTAASSLAGIGQTGLNNAMSAYAARLNAAGAPQDLFNRYGALAFGTPASSYNNYGPVGQTTNTSGYQMGVDFSKPLFSPMGKFPGMGG